jgi:hypothetical protein
VTAGQEDALTGWWGCRSWQTDGVALLTWVAVVKHNWQNFVAEHGLYNRITLDNATPRTVSANKKSAADEKAGLRAYMVLEQ